MIEAVITYSVPLTPDKSLLYKTSSDLSLVLGYLMPISEHAMRVHDSAMFITKTEYKADFFVYETVHKTECNTKVNKDYFIGSELKGVFSSNSLFGKQHNYKEPFFKQHYDWGNHNIREGIYSIDYVFGEKLELEAYDYNTSDFVRTSNLNNAVVVVDTFDYIDFYGGFSYNYEVLFARHHNEQKGIIDNGDAILLRQLTEYAKIFTTRSLDIGTYSKGAMESQSITDLSGDTRHLNAYVTDDSLKLPSRYIHGKLTDTTVKTLTKGLWGEDVIHLDITTKLLRDEYSALFVGLPFKKIYGESSYANISRGVKEPFFSFGDNVSRTNKSVWSNEQFFIDPISIGIVCNRFEDHANKTNNSLFYTEEAFMHKLSDGITDTNTYYFGNKVNRELVGDDLSAYLDYAPRHIHDSDTELFVDKTSSNVSSSISDVLLAKMSKCLVVDELSDELEKTPQNLSERIDEEYVFKTAPGIYTTDYVTFEKNVDDRLLTHVDFSENIATIEKDIYSKMTDVNIAQSAYGIIINTGDTHAKRYSRNGLEVFKQDMLYKYPYAMSGSNELVLFNKNPKSFWWENTDVLFNKYNKPTMHSDSLFAKRVDQFPMFEQDTVTQLNKYNKPMYATDTELMLYDLPSQIFSTDDAVSLYKVPSIIDDRDTTLGVGKYEKNIGHVDSSLGLSKWYDEVSAFTENLFIDKNYQHTNADGTIDTMKKNIIKYLTIDDTQDSVDAIMYDTRVIETHLIEQYYQPTFTMDMARVKLPPKLPVNMAGQQEFLAFYDIRKVTVTDGENIYSDTPDKYVIENYKELAGIDELILSHSDFDYSVYEEKLIVNGDINPSYIKRIDDGNLYVRYPIENPVKLMADIATVYKDVPVNTVEYVTKKAYSLWRQNIFTYSGMKPDEALRDLVKKVYDNLELQFTTEKNLYEAYRVARLFRWYAEMSILNNSEYMLKLNCNNVVPDYDNIDIGEIGQVMTLTNLGVSQDLLVESVTRGQPSSMRMECERYHTMYITAKMYMYNGSVKVVVNDKEVEYTEPYTELKIEIPIGKSTFDLQFTQSAADGAVQFSQLTIEEYDIESYDIIYDGKIGESNKTIEFLIDTLIIAEDSIDNVQKNIGNATAVANALDAMRNYFEIHHKDKDKGKRLINKFS